MCPTFIGLTPAQNTQKRGKNWRKSLVKYFIKCVKIFFISTQTPFNIQLSWGFVEYHGLELGCAKHTCLTYRLWNAVDFFIQTTVVRNQRAIAEWFEPAPSILGSRIRIQLKCCYKHKMYDDYFDQRLGAAHSKRWSKICVFKVFCAEKLKKTPKKHEIWGKI